MNLNDFENYIDWKIIERGCRYYDDGHLASIKEINDFEYRAEVAGTEFYIVNVKLDEEENIVNTWCNCPYDMGEYCKHQVTVFLALRDIKTNNVVKDNQDSNKRSMMQSFIPMKAKAQAIYKILSKRSKEEMIEILLNITTEYDEIRQRIELDYSNVNDADEILKSTALIRTYISSSSDRHGYVAYSDAYEAVKGAGLVLEKARDALKLKKTLHTLDLALCIVHEMIDLLDTCDDSDGVVENIVNECFDLIDQMIEEKEIMPSDKEYFFNKLLEESSNSRYKGWIYWQLGMLNRCSEFADISSLRTKLEDCLSSIIKDARDNSWTDDYIEEEIIQIKYDIILRYDGAEKAQKFVHHNLKYPSFRRMVIEDAMQRKDYDSVIKLTLDGEKKDRKHLGLTGNWKRLRYDAYKLSGMIEEQRKLAMDFFLAGSFEDYIELKNCYEQKEWSTIYPEIISKMDDQKKKYWGSYPMILIEEGEKRKLLEYVIDNPSSIEKHYKHLIPHYKEKVCFIFINDIERSAHNARTRRAYQEVCSIIRNLKNAGGLDEASMIKQKLYSQYKNRPAFLDELSKI